jgi:hypothetical protein
MFVEHHFSELDYESMDNVSSLGIIRNFNFPKLSCRNFVEISDFV